MITCRTTDLKKERCYKNTTGFSSEKIEPECGGAHLYYLSWNAPKIGYKRSDNVFHPEITLFKVWVQDMIAINCSCIRLILG